MNPSIYAFLADAVVVLHLAFVVFACLGGVLVFRFPWIKWLHIPAFLWAGYIEITGGICPLTPLENRLRFLSMEPMYANSFIERYVWNLLYPAELSHGLQITLGVGLIVINLAVYAVVLTRVGRGQTRQRTVAP